MRIRNDRHGEARLAGLGVPGGGRLRRVSNKVARPCSAVGTAWSSASGAGGFRSP